MKISLKIFDDKYLRRSVIKILKYMKYMHFFYKEENNELKNMQLGNCFNSKNKKVR